MRESGSISPLILAGVLILSLAGSAVYIYGRIQLPKTPPQNVLPTPIISLGPDLVQDELNSWKTYSDNEAGFALKYPQSFTLKSYQESQFEGFQLVYIGPTQTASGRIQTELSEGAMLKILKIKTNQPLKNYSEERRVADGKIEDEMLPVKVSGLQEIMLDGKAAYSYLVESRGNAQMTYIQIPGSILQVAGYYTEQKYLDLVNKILSTFKFT